jgi:mannitol-specific phosphotransferase system IIBC component
MPLLGRLPPVGGLRESGQIYDGWGVERRDVMKSRAFLWMVALLIGAALSFSVSSPVVAQGKSDEKKAEEVKKGEQKKEGEGKKKSEGKKSDEKKTDGKAKSEEKKM